MALLEARGVDQNFTSANSGVDTGDKRDYTHRYTGRTPGIQACGEDIRRSLLLEKSHCPDEAGTRLAKPVSDSGAITRNTGIYTGEVHGSTYSLGDSGYYFSLSTLGDY